MRQFYNTIFLLAVLSAVSANAQFNKGDKMVGMSLGSFFLNSGKSDISFPQVRGYISHSNSWGLNIEPVIGFFISSKTAVGGTILIHPSAQKSTFKDGGITFQEEKNSNFSIGLGPFIRTYFGSKRSSLTPFGHAGFNAGISSASSEGFRYYDSNPDYKTSSDGKASGGFFANAHLQVGASRMVGENATLDFSLGYFYSYKKHTYKTTTLTDLDINGTIDFRSESETTSKYTNHGMVLGVGFQVFIRRKK